MNWILSVLIGIALAVLTLYFIKNQAPVAIETFVQQPVHKGADISEQDSMLVAVGLQALYTPRASVMDATQISKDAWMASQSAATGGPAAAVPQLVKEEPAAPGGAATSTGAGMASSPMWSAGAVAAQASVAGTGAQQVFLPGGTAPGDGGAPPPMGPSPSGPKAKTPAEIQAEKDRALAKADENQALLSESAAAKATRDKIEALKLEAERTYKTTWLPAQTPTSKKTDSAANRSEYVASLIAKHKIAQLNHNNYFESEWKQANGAYAGDAARTAAFKKAQVAAQQVLNDDQAMIDSLDVNWQKSNSVDCYPLPWDTVASETACSKTCGPGRKVQTRKYQEPVSGGKACPPVAARETREVDCNLRACVRTTTPSSATCAPGWTYRATDKKCTNTSQVAPSEGCGAGFAYNTATGYCTKAGSTQYLPTAPPGFTYNLTTKKFEQVANPVFTCATAGFNLYSGILGTTYPPTCVGDV